MNGGTNFICYRQFIHLPRDGHQSIDWFICCKTWRGSLQRYARLCVTGFRCELYFHFTIFPGCFISVTQSCILPTWSLVRMVIAIVWFTEDQDWFVSVYKWSWVASEVASFARFVYWYEGAARLGDKMMMMMTTSRNWCNFYWIIPRIAAKVTCALNCRRTIL